MRAALFLLVAGAAASAASAQRILFAGGNWAAIDFGARCEARSKAVGASRGSEPFAGFAFEPAAGRNGQFYARLSRPARSGAAVILTIGSQPFLLAANGDWAWSRDLLQQRSIIAASRLAGAMRVDSRDQRGRRIIDRYLLAGAATAVDSAAAGCAGKVRRR